MYNVETNSWEIDSTSLQPSPDGRFGHACCSLNPSTMVVMGGVDAFSDRNDLLAVSKQSPR